MSVKFTEVGTTVVMKENILIQLGECLKEGNDWSERSNKSDVL